MKPCLIIDGVDFTYLLNANSLKWSRNDIDSESTGRNTLNAAMRRYRLATKYKLEVSNLKRMTTEETKALSKALKPQIITVKTLSFDEGIVERDFYNSSINAATAYYDNNIGDTLWDDVSFSITEV